MKILSVGTSARLKTSTPNVSRHVEHTDTGHSPDVSVILMERSTSAPILVSNDTTPKIEDNLQFGQSGSNRRLEKTFLKECAEQESNTSRGFKKSVRIRASEGEMEELYIRKGGKIDVSNDGRSFGVDPARIAEESNGRSSEVDSPSSSCASARAQYFHNKLLATLQILQNKEETVRVQAESLAVAEARIAFLTARSNELKREVERKGQELKTLRDTIHNAKIEQIDASAQIQEIDNQKNIVTTLQNNLSVIEDLYRECFYETANQEGLIELLRKSYLDVRLMDKEKSDQISRLHNVINTQKWSLDKCQDIASDVDDLKMEISNFLNSSNNDSGVWEESLAGDLTEDLQDIAGQLLRLMELLAGDCTCGLQLENRRLQQNNDSMEKDLDNLRQKIADLEHIMETKDTVDRQHLEQIRAKESELHLIRQQLAEVECDTRERGQTCESIKLQLDQTQVLLEVRTAELQQVQSQCQEQEMTIRQLKEELDQSKEISKEYCALRGSTCAAQRRVRVLRAELAKALEHCAHLESCHRSEVQALESALWEAQARGAALCEEARRATTSVRAWTRHRKNLHREQETQIKKKESQIRLLELRLERGQNDTTLTRGSDHDTCSKCVSARSLNSFERKNIRTESKSSERHIRSASQQQSCSNDRASGSRVRREYSLEGSGSEIGCSSTPVPPQRPSRFKRFFCEDRVPSSTTRDASVQRPVRRDAMGSAGSSVSDVSHVSPVCRRYRVGRVHIDTMPREVFGGSVEDILSRVESAGAALADSLRRWRRHEPAHRV